MYNWWDRCVFYPNDVLFFPRWLGSACEMQQANEMSGI